MAYTLNLRALPHPDILPRQRAGPLDSLPGPGNRAAVQIEAARQFPDVVKPAFFSGGHRRGLIRQQCGQPRLTLPQIAIFRHRPHRYALETTAPPWRPDARCRAGKALGALSLGDRFAPTVFRPLPRFFGLMIAPIMSLRARPPFDQSHFQFELKRLKLSFGSPRCAGRFELLFDSLFRFHSKDFSLSDAPLSTMARAAGRLTLASSPAPAP